MARLLAAFLAFLAVSLSPPSQAANTWGTDFSDMWWIPAESGWGANVAHQREIVFLTLYVYGSDSRIRWYAATSMASRGGDNANVFEGSLYEFAGPYYGTDPFNPASVGARQVGTIFLSFQSSTSGTLTYSIDGVLVSKVIQRQTFRDNNMAGTYEASLSNVVSGCFTGDGPRFSSGITTISHAADNAVFLVTNLNGGTTCNYTGRYAQSGRLGRIDGTLSCSDGQSGTFTMADIEAGYLGFMGQYSASYGGSCTESGTMAGLRR
jgi:hypothetical protein